MRGFGHVPEAARRPLWFKESTHRPGETEVKTTGCLHACLVISVVSDSLKPYGQTVALCPWDSPGKNTGVDCHALLQGIFPIWEVCEVQGALCWSVNEGDLFFPILPLERVWGWGKSKGLGASPRGCTVRISHVLPV